MSFTRSQRIKLRTVLTISVVWTIIALIFAVLDHLFLKATQENGGMSHYHLETNLLTTALLIPAAGLFAGGIIVYFLREQVRKLHLGAVLLIDTVIIAFSIILISVPGSLLYNSLYFGLPLWDEHVINNAWEFLGSYGVVHTLLFWSLISAVTMIVLQVNDKYGQGVFLRLLQGKYHRPKVESRIFMFLDIRSSTTLAEQLGHVRWFELLNQFFTDITEPIIDTHGEIYQYVGDEIIIHWDLENGLRQNNCIQCFFEIKRKIESLAEGYQQRYGVVPRFKAGLHYGQVTIGEIGKIKKDIVFSGDVLNTTSRIQDLCNTYETDLLASLEVIEKLKDTLGLFINPVGFIELRGKQVPVSLFAVTTTHEKGMDSSEKKVLKIA